VGAVIDPWLIFWLLAVGVLGGIVGWVAHGLVEERRHEDRP
jgi:hypothetical protein